MTQGQANRLATDIMDELGRRFIRPMGSVTTQVAKVTEQDYAVTLHTGLCTFQFTSRDVWEDQKGFVR
jgi:hypothetical protein